MESAPNVTVALAMASVAANGILAGASLDQSIKQLPARHLIGLLAYSRYSQASDLGSGVVWYATLGVGAALLTLGAALAAFRQRVPAEVRTPLAISACLAILHSLATTQAAPTNFSQRKVVNDKAALAEVFDRFERWQTARATLQVLNLIAALWALAAAQNNRKY